MESWFRTLHMCHHLFPTQSLTRVRIVPGQSLLKFGSQLRARFEHTLRLGNLIPKPKGEFEPILNGPAADRIKSCCSVHGIPFPLSRF